MCYCDCIHVVNLREPLFSVSQDHTSTERGTELLKKFAWLKKAGVIIIKQRPAFYSCLSVFWYIKAR